MEWEGVGADGVEGFAGVTFRRINRCKTYSLTAKAQGALRLRHYSRQTYSDYFN